MVFLLGSMWQEVRLGITSVESGLTWPMPSRMAVQGLPVTMQASAPYIVSSMPILAACSFMATWFLLMMDSQNCE